MAIKAMAGAAMIIQQPAGDAAGFRRTQFILMGCVIVAVLIELVSRIVGAENPFLGDTISLISHPLLACSVLFLVYLFAQSKSATAAMGLAVSAAVFTGWLRFASNFEAVAQFRFFDATSELHQRAIVLLDYTAIAGLIVGFFLIVFEMGKTKVELISKSESLEREIEERKRAEHERLELETQLHQAQKLEGIGLLAGGIAHDFNNILMGILGNAKLAGEDISKDSPLSARIEAIEKGTEQAGDLTRQLLAYAGKSRPKIEPVDLSVLVKDMVDLLQVTVSKNVELRLDLDSKLPAVDCDVGQIRQIIINLLTNAAEALQGRSGSLNIRTGVRYCSSKTLAQGPVHDPLPEGDYAFIEVTDSGEGIDERTRARMFDPFYTTKFPGRGLGLSAVIGIVRGHRGKLLVQSDPGEGATFTVLLPTSDKPIAQRGESRPLGLAGRSGHGKVLLVEDEEIVRNVTALILERGGYSVVTAADGEEGVEIFERLQGEITHVLLDLTMPRMDGREALKRIREMDPEASVVLMSGLIKGDIQQTPDGAAPNAFIQKPYQPNDLLDLLDKLTVSC